MLFDLLKTAILEVAKLLSIHFKKKLPMKKIFLLIVLVLGWYSGFSQVVTPRLDSGFPVELSSAAGWRIGSGIGGNTAVGKEESSAEDLDYHYIDSSVIFFYQPSHVVTEIYWKPAGTQYEWDTSTDALVETSTSDARFTLTIRGENRFSVGIGYRSQEKDYLSFNSTTTSYEGSFSIRVFEGLYMAGGFQRFSEKMSIGDARKWNKILGGVALQIGDPLGSMFRLEGSYGTSPETESDNQIASTKPQEDEIRASVEFLFDPFLISYSYQNFNYSALNGASDKKSTVNHGYGLGMKFGSFTLGLYLYLGTETFGDAEMKTTKVQSTFSYNFI